MNDLKLTAKEKAAVKKDFTKNAWLNTEEEKLVASAIVKCMISEVARHENSKNK